MAQIGYTAPGVYTDVQFAISGVPAVGTARIPVIIGEGLEYFEEDNIELHRGSSASVDDQVTDEDLSNQVTGLTRSFQVTYFPVVTGDGTGTVTNDPNKIQATSQGIPLTVISLNGATGVLMLQDIVPAGADLHVAYFFKRTDTQILNEDLSGQIPTFASLTVTPSGGNSIQISTTLPGEQSNNLTIQFVAGLPQPDALAVSGAGTDQITINISKAPSGTRSLQDLANLIAAGIPTLSGGYLTAGAITGDATTVLVAGGAAALAGGAGPQSNTTFKTNFTPIVDGSNGGVTTTDITKVIVTLGGAAAVVATLDGANGLITLAAPINKGGLYGSPSLVPSTGYLLVTYYFNKWQNTSDLLQASNVSVITEVGLGPNRADFEEGIDYVLSSDGTSIAWGASVSTVAGFSTSQIAFGAAQINTTLVDEHVYLRQATGAANGRNTVFVLADVPTDGSGLARPTDVTANVAVFIGLDPLAAFQAGAVGVAQLDGDAAQITLFNPPQYGQNVYASYTRNILNDHQFTLTVLSSGKYSVIDEINRALEVITAGTNTVADGGFATTGIVFPYNRSDVKTVQGAPSETVTLTFRNDGNATIVAPTQGAVVFTWGAATLTITSTKTGLAADAVTVAVDITTLSPVPVQVNGNAVTIYAFWKGVLLNNTAIAAFFPSAETNDGGQLTAVAGGTPASAQVEAATALAGGTDGLYVPVTHSYTVSSSLPSGGSAGIGYLNQTYIDARTGFQCTIVNPADALSFGYTSLPSPMYVYAYNDTLEFVVTQSTTAGSGFTPGSALQIAIPGIVFSVASTLGPNPGDTAIVNTFNKSGNNPAIGEFYYVSYQVAKTAQDFAIQLFSNPADAYAVYGTPNTVNRVSLGIQLMTQNGAQQFGVVQVPKQKDANGNTLNTASDQAFISAIQTLTVQLPGLQRKADVIIALSTSPTVQQFLSRQLITQATPRQKGEAIGFVGFSQFTTPAQASAQARSLKNSRIIAIGAAVAGILIPDPVSGVNLEYAVDGAFLAAAMAGLNANPANDPATTLTRQNLVGFSRLLIKYDDPTYDNEAAAGLTVLIENNGALIIRHYKSSDPSSPLTSEPTSTTAVDYTRQQFRSDMDQFIGRKLVSDLVSVITATAAARLSSLVNQQILGAYKNLNVQPDAVDPTTVNITVAVQPIFSLLYINITFTVSVSL